MPSRALAAWGVISILCTALAVAAAPAGADEVGGDEIVVPGESDAAAEPNDDNWQFELAPYVWFLFIEGTTTFDYETSDVDIGFDDIWNQLHMGFFLFLRTNAELQILIVAGRPFAGAGVGFVWRDAIYAPARVT